MLLTIDVGNTNTVLGTFLGEDLVHSWRVKTDPRSTADELWLQMRALVEGIDITGLSICSTVPATLREMRTMIAQYFSETPTTIVEPGIKTGVPLLVDNPKEIGADRIVNTLAAHTLYGGPAIVVKRLFDLVQPDFAVFGEKDFQQLFLIKEMVKKFNLPIDIVSHLS